MTHGAPPVDSGRIEEEVCCSQHLHFATITPLTIVGVGSQTASIQKTHGATQTSGIMLSGWTHLACSGFDFMPYAMSVRPCIEVRVASSWFSFCASAAIGACPRNDMACAA